VTEPDAGPAPDSILHRVRVVLFEPQNPINIAATIRAMKNMGVRDLALVRPVEISAYRIEGIAHDTLDVIERMRTVDSLDEALAGCVHVAALTARRRRHKWQLATPRTLAPDLLAHAGRGDVAVMFGREDHGLPNEALDRAHTMVTIPTTDHASLNLAQAVMVTLYELHLAADDATRTLAPPRKDAPPAASEDYERYFADVERALETIDFFKTRFRRHIMRSVRSLAFRAAPDARELTLMRAMHIEVVRATDRLRASLGLPPLVLRDAPATDGGEDLMRAPPDEDDGPRDDP
jgi:TrmH family RNA methyltransferase